MKTIEITVKVNETKEIAKEKLLSNGYIQTSNEYCDDIYMTQDLNLLKDKNNILELLNRSVLLRHHYGMLEREREKFYHTKK